jgi:predicted nucleotidyltransferase
VNGDGTLDLAVTNFFSGTISVLLNTTAPGAATPNFATQVQFGTGVTGGATRVAMGDVNGDGKLDLAVDNEYNNNVWVLLNTTALGAATPSFAGPVSFTTGISPFAVALGDLNGDGKLDLTVPNFRDNTFSVMLNTTALGAATPSFATQVQFPSGTPGDDPYAVALGDVNGDGKLDVAVANYNSGTVSVFLNQTALGAATPSFSAQIQFSTGNGASSVRLGDVNGDGKVDLAVSNPFGNTVSVLLNTTASGATTPSFATLASFAVGSSPTAVALGDVNGDGKEDLMVSNFFSDTVSVLLNTTAPGATTPSFASQVPFSTGSGANDVALGDVNGDGKLDVAVPNWNSGTVSVLLNQ